MQRKTSKGAAPARVAGAPTLDIPPDTTAENLIGTINDRLRRTYKAAVDVRQQASSASSPGGVLVNGTPKGTGDINLKAGQNVTLAGAQNGQKVDVTVNSATALRVDKNGTLVGTRGELNLIEGTNVTLTVADNSGSGRVDVTINASGGGGGGGIPAPTIVAPPAAAGFTNANTTGGSSIADGNNMLVVNAGTSTSQWYPFYKAIPSNPYTLEIGFFMTGTYNSGLFGMTLSDGTKFRYFYQGTDLRLQYNTAVNSFSSLQLDHATYGCRGTVAWLKVQDDGTNRTFYISANGFDYAQVYTEASSANFVPTQIGVCVWRPTSLPAIMSVFHWKVS